MTSIDELKKAKERKVKTGLKTFLIGAGQPSLASELAEKFKTDRPTILRLVDAIAQEGSVFSFSEHGILLVKDFLPTHDTIKIKGNEIAEVRFGFTADNHLASKYSRLDVLNSLFDYWLANGITTVYQMGNIIDGEFRWNRNDLLAHGIEGQLDYLVDNWPARKGITTKFITGDDHEGWYIQREGINIGVYAEKKAVDAGRHDLKFLGHMEHNITLGRTQGKSTVRLIHGGGGTAYAISYTDQKYAESLQGGEKPNVVLVGHFHKWNYGFPREIHAVQVGCTEDQTPFMRKKRIQAMVGGGIVTIKQDLAGVIRSCNAEWIPFYDRSFYANDKLWKYRWK
jgi:hypothetical protein